MLSINEFSASSSATAEASFTSKTDLEAGKAFEDVLSKTRADLSNGEAQAKQIKQEKTESGSSMVETTSSQAIATAGKTDAVEEQAASAVAKAGDDSSGVLKGATNLEKQKDVAVELKASSAVTLATKSKKSIPDAKVTSGKTVQSKADIQTDTSISTVSSTTTNSVIDTQVDVGTKKTKGSISTVKLSAINSKSDLKVSTKINADESSVQNIELKANVELVSGKSVDTVTEQYKDSDSKPQIQVNISAITSPNVKGSGDSPMPTVKAGRSSSGLLSANQTQLGSTVAQAVSQLVVGAITEAGDDSAVDLSPAPTQKSILEMIKGSGIAMPSETDGEIEIIGSILDKSSKLAKINESTLTIQDKEPSFNVKATLAMLDAKDTKVTYQKIMPVGLEIPESVLDSDPLFVKETSISELLQNRQRKNDMMVIMDKSKTDLKGENLIKNEIAQQRGLLAAEPQPSAKAIESASVNASFLRPDAVIQGASGQKMTKEAAKEMTMAELTASAKKGRAISSLEKDEVTELKSRITKPLAVEAASRSDATAPSSGAVDTKSAKNEIRLEGTTDQSLAQNKAQAFRLNNETQIKHPVGSQEFAEKIQALMDEVNENARKNLSFERITVTVNPERLGKIQITGEYRNGVVDLEIKTESQETLDALKSLKSGEGTQLRMVRVDSIELSNQAKSLADIKGELAKTSEAGTTQTDSAIGNVKTSEFLDSHKEQQNRQSQFEQLSRESSQEQGRRKYQEKAEASESDEFLGELEPTQSVSSTSTNLFTRYA